MGVWSWELSLYLGSGTEKGRDHSGPLLHWTSTAVHPYFHPLPSFCSWLPPRTSLVWLQEACRAGRRQATSGPAGPAPWPHPGRYCSMSHTAGLLG